MIFCGAAINDPQTNNRAAARQGEKDYVSATNRKKLEPTSHQLLRAIQFVRVKFGIKFGKRGVLVKNFQKQ
jgi:hypothetical protein